jgi:hypothetical protein
MDRRVHPKRAGSWIVSAHFERATRIGPRCRRVRLALERSTRMTFLPRPLPLADELLEATRRLRPTPLSEESPGGSA